MRIQQRSLNLAKGPTGKGEKITITNLLRKLTEKKIWR